MRSGKATIDDFIVTNETRLNGFTMAKKGGEATALARETFPSRRTSASTLPLTKEALDHRCVVGRPFLGFSERNQPNFVVVAEPLSSGAGAWRVLVTAIQAGSLHRADGWFRRVGFEEKGRVAWRPETLSEQPKPKYLQYEFKRGKAVLVK